MASKKVTENIVLCPDGVYRWVYEFPMLKNPVLLVTVWKVLLVSCGICLVLVGIPLAITDGLQALKGIVTGFAGAAVVLGVLSIAGYLLLAAIYGWKYMVLFEMDETQVRHIQMKKQFEKAQALGWLTAMAGLVAGSMGAAGAGLLGATRDTFTSEFAKVKKVKANKALHTIWVNHLLERNQIYAEDADFDFVLQYILERVPK